MLPTLPLRKNSFKKRNSLSLEIVTKKKNLLKSIGIE